MDQERLHYLDAARGFAILLVVLGHIWETDQPLPVLIYSFHVPLFFVVSGILADYTGRAHRPLKQLALSGLRGLIVPYVFFEVVFLAIFGLRNHFDFSSQSAHVYDGLFLSPLNVPLWFLPTLFFAELILILLLRLIRSRKAAALICLALYLVPFCPGVKGLLPNALLRLLSSVGFLAAGYFASGFIRTKNPPSPLLLFTAIANCTLAWLNGKTGVYKLTFHNPLLFTVCALTGSLCTIFLLKKLTQEDPLRPAPEHSSRGILRLASALLVLAGRNSLTILGLHIIVLRILQEILGLHTDSIVGGLLALAGICLMLTPVCWFLNRFFPFLIGKSTQKTVSK